jgi:hypothetical protein
MSENQTTSESSREHFTFEMYSPTSISATGVPMMQRLNLQFSGQNLTKDEIIKKIEQFLGACGK